MGILQLAVVSAELRQHRARAMHDDNRLASPHRNEHLTGHQPPRTDAGRTTHGARAFRRLPGSHQRHRRHGYAHNAKHDGRSGQQCLSLLVDRLSRHFSRGLRCLHSSVTEHSCRIALGNLDQRQLLCVRLSDHAAAFSLRLVQSFATSISVGLNRRTSAGMNGLNIVITARSHAVSVTTAMRPK